MAELSQLYPNTPALGGYAGGMVQGQQVVDAQQNQQMNRQMALQDLWKRQQMDPLEVQGKQLSNEGLGISNRKGNIDADSADYDLQLKQHFKRQDYQKRLDDYVKQHDAADLEKMINQVRQGMLSSNPQERALAMKLHPFIGTVADKLLEIKATGDQQARSATIHADASRYAADKSFEARTANKKAAANDLESRLTSTKGDPVRALAYINDFISQMDPSDPDLPKYQARASALAAQVQQSQDARLGLARDDKGQIIPRTNVPTVPVAGKSQWTPPDGWK